MRELSELKGIRTEQLEKRGQNQNFQLNIEFKIKPIKQ
jgi:hypothetical protein